MRQIILFPAALLWLQNFPQGSFTFPGREYPESGSYPHNYPIYQGFYLSKHAVKNRQIPVNTGQKHQRGKRDQHYSKQEQDPENKIREMQKSEQKLYCNKSQENHYGKNKSLFHGFVPPVNFRG